MTEATSPGAAALPPWAVEFRYEMDDEPPLDRGAVLALIEDLRRWATEVVQR